MSKFLRGLAFAFLMLGFACAAYAAATGRHALEAGVCFLLEIVFVWLNSRHLGALRDTSSAQVEEPDRLQARPLIATVRLVSSSVTRTDGFNRRQPVAGGQASSPTRSYIRARSANRLRQHEHGRTFRVWQRGQR